jgi:hypothetical protein
MQEITTSTEEDVDSEDSEQTSRTMGRKHSQKLSTSKPRQTRRGDNMAICLGRPFDELAAYHVKSTGTAMFLRATAKTQLLVGRKPGNNTGCT